MKIIILEKEKEKEKEKSNLEERRRPSGDPRTLFIEEENRPVLDHTLGFEISGEVSGRAIASARSLI